LLDGAREAGHTNVHHFPDAETAAEFLAGFIQEDDLVLIKASRGIGLDKIVTKLTSDDRQPTTDNQGGRK
ncbi:MAG TPA: hypothetical protein VF057_05970, partial [Thermoanaerobaculia bacterium]